MTRKLGMLIAAGMLLASCGGTVAPASTSFAPASPATSKPTASAAASSSAASAVASAKPAAASAATSGAAKPAAGSSAAPIPSSPPSSNAQNGQLLFATDGCYECHDYQGQGGQGTGPKLAPSPLPWVAFAAQVRTPRQDMPKYPVQFLSDQDLGDIYAYLQTMPAAPNPSSLPLLTNR